MCHSQDGPKQCTYLDRQAGRLLKRWSRHYQILSANGSNLRIQLRTDHANEAPNPSSNGGGRRPLEPRGEFSPLG